MPPFNILERIRETLTRQTAQSGKMKRRLRLVQLEDRRMLNGAIAAAGIDLTGSETLTISQGNNVDVGGGTPVATVNLTLTTGTWNGIDAGLNGDLYNLDGTGRILTVDASVLGDGGFAVGGGNELRVHGDNPNSQHVNVDLTGLTAADSFIPSNGIVFTGGERVGGGDADTLSVFGYSAATVDTLTLSHTGQESGTIGLSDLGEISYSEIEPLALGGTAANLIINLPAGADPTVRLTDNGVAGDGISQITGAFELTTFANPTVSLTINDGTGVKAISVRGLDSLFDADVSILEDDAVDDNTVTFEINTTDIDTGTLHVEAGPIALNASIITTGNVELLSTDSITDGNAGAVNITAGTATLSAVNGIGSGNAIETNITQLEATNSTAGLIEITEVAAGTDIALGAVNNGTRNVTITSAAGAITDGNGATLNITAGTATLSAVTGIGSSNAIETNITRLEATNTTAGLIEISEVAAGTDIALGAVNNGTRNVTITSAAGAITDANGATLNITAGTATLSAVTGIGSGNAIETNITQLEATNTTAGLIEITEDAAGVDIALGAVNNGNRIVTITSAAGAITDGNVATLNITAGTATLSAVTGIGSGNAIETNITQLEATNTRAGLIEITEVAAGIDIALGAVHNGTRNVTITSAAGAIADGNGATLNITAGTATLSAVTGIGSGNAIETNITQLEATNTTAGLIEITEDAAGVDIALGAINNGNRNVTITSAAGAITDGNVATLNITAGTATLSAVNGVGSGDAIETNITQLEATNTTAGLIEITEVAAGVDIVLGAVNNPGRDVILVSLAGSIPDGNGAAVNVTARNLTITASGDVGSGSTDVFKGVFNEIEVLLTGNLTVTAGGTAAIAGTIAGATTITATTGYVSSIANLDVMGFTFTVTNLALIADSDNNGTGVLTLGGAVAVAGDLRIQGADVAPAGAITLSANRILFRSLATETLNVTTGTLDATAADLTVTSTGPTLSLLDLDCDNVALQSTANTGSVSLTAAGTVTVSDDIIAGNDAITTSSGNIFVTATNITISDTILADNGNITILATNNILLDAAPIVSEDANGDGALDNDDLNVITTIRGNITVTADSDNNPAGAGGSLTQQDGHRIIAGRDVVAYLPGINGDPSSAIQSLHVALTATAAGEAQVAISADGDVLLASVQSANNTITAIVITSKSGGMIDGGDTDVNIFANRVGALVTIRAVTGIGSIDIDGVPGPIDPCLELCVSSIDAVNTLSGDLGLMEQAAGGDLNVNRAQNNAIGGRIAIGVESGNLTLDAGGFGVSTSNGDVLLDAGAELTLDQAISAGTADVRLVANGNMTQSAFGVITADELGVRQESVTPDLDILLGDNNVVNRLAAFNASDRGAIVFNNVDDLTISTVSAQTICDAVFVLTAGVQSTFTGAPVLADALTDGDILIQSGGFLTLNQQVNATAADVRLIGNGDITQAPAGTITADELGVRQQSATLSDIELGNGNDVNHLAALNQADFGHIAFNNVDDLTINTASTQTIDGVTFTAQSGVLTTFSSAAVQDDASDDGDILIRAGGFLTLSQQVNAGQLAAGDETLADARLIANGNISQIAAGVITADELGVRQQSAALSDIDLGDGNDVNHLAALNQADLSHIVFNDVDNLTINTVSAQTIDGVVFNETSGVETTFSGAATLGDSSDNGDILLQAGLATGSGFLALNDQVNAGRSALADETLADIRLILHGDVTQSVAGIITADELGVRQQSALLSAIEFGDGNDVNHLAAVNQSAGGVIVFHDIDGLTVNAVSAQTIDTVSFAATDGASTANGDILLRADGFQTFERPVNAGTADVRLTAMGDISQSVTGIFTSDELGVRQEGVTVTAGNDTDLSGGYDILLGGRRSVSRNNDVNSFAAFNGFSAGIQVSRIVINNIDAVIISSVAVQSLDGVSFTATAGIQAVGDKSQVEVVATGTITILNDIRAGVNAPVNTETTIDDTDGDEIANSVDPDVDGDTTSNLLDTDDDGDGILDTADVTPDGQTGETIHVLSIDGNINIGTGVIISTDEDITAGVSSPVTGDAILVVADFNEDGANPDTNNDGLISPGEDALITQGKVTFGNNVELRTDGGVANHFYDRILPGGPGTSFFAWPGVPLVSTVARSGTDYVVTFSVTINSTGEENLHMNIDWRDPTGMRIESIDFLTPGNYAVSHIYSFIDFTSFVDAGNDPFLVDFSVSHNQSIHVIGGTVQQGAGPVIVVPGQVLTTTDDPSTPPAIPPMPPGLTTAEIVTNNEFSNRDFHFEDGLVEVKIPTLFLAPIVPDPPRPAPPAPPEPVPNLVVPVLVYVAPAEVAEMPFSSYSTQSEDYFQLRDGVTGKVIEGYEHIKDEFGELLLQPARLKQ